MADTSSRTVTTLFIAVLVIVFLVALGYWMSTDRTTAEIPLLTPNTAEVTPPDPTPVVPSYEPEPEPETTPATESAPPVIEPQEPALPELNFSDAPVKKDLSKLTTKQSIQKTLLKLITPDEIIRKAVIAVENGAQGKLSLQHPVIQPPATPIGVKVVRISDSTKTYQFTDSNFERYSDYVDTFNQLETDDIIKMYKHYAPLLEDAYGELGIANQSFDEQFKKTLDVMLATPELDGKAEMIRPSVFYQYVDAELETLPELQKMVLRLGPENAHILKKKLQEVRNQLP